MYIIKLEGKNKREKSWEFYDVGESLAGDSPRTGDEGKEVTHLFGAFQGVPFICLNDYYLWYI